MQQQQQPLLFLRCPLLGLDRVSSTAETKGPTIGIVFHSSISVSCHVRHRRAQGRITGPLVSLLLPRLSRCPCSGVDRDSFLLWLSHSSLLASVQTVHPGWIDERDLSSAVSLAR